MNINSSLDKKVLIFLLFSLGLIVLPHIYHLPPSLLAFFYLLLGWRFTCIWKTGWLPNRLLVFFLTVCGLALLYHQHQGVFGRDAGTSLFVIALGLKLLEIKTERDVYLINFLAFIVAASQFLFEQSILMAAYILFVCSVLLATLFCINSRYDETVTALSYAALLILQALPISIGLFVLFPRVEAPRWMLFDNNHARTGLSDIMEPGSISNLALSGELVFRVKFSGPLPPPSERYWRGPVLSHTDGKRWTQAPHADSQQIQPIPKFTGVSYQYTLLMEPQNKNWVYALDMAAIHESSLRQKANYLLVTLNNPDKRAEYRLTSYPHYNTGALSPEEYHDAMQLPGKASDKIRQLIERLQGFSSPPENFIRQILHYFRVESFHYTLTPPLLEDKPIETFLFDTRRGFCSHYASAFVYLMRVANIPARVVIGFQGGELNKAGNFLEIKQSDAHAWAEVWLPNRGWVRVDPTAAIAPERIEQTIDADRLAPDELIHYLPAGANALSTFNWVMQARQLWGHIDYNWQRWVINYDNNNQSRFLSNLGIRDINTMIFWMIAITSAMMGLIAWLLLYQKRKTTDKVLQAYNRFCKKIAERGLTKKTAEGPLAYAARIKIKFPEHTKNIDQITAVFINLRYGKNPAPDDLKTFDRLVTKFKI